MNGPAVEAILHSIDIPIQLGGGIRTMAGIDTWLGRGVHRVILGTAALEEPALVREACLKHPDRIVIGIDARNGKVATDGWTKTSTVDATTLARQYADCAVAAIVYTDIDRDGVLAGPNIDETAALARAVDIPVTIASAAHLLQTNHFVYFVRSWYFCEPKAPQDSQSSCSGDLAPGSAHFLADGGWFIEPSSCGSGSNSECPFVHVHRLGDLQ